MRDEERDLNVHVDEPAAVEDLADAEQDKGGSHERDQHEGGGSERLLECYSYLGSFLYRNKDRLREDYSYLCHGCGKTRRRVENRVGYVTCL